MRCSHCLLVIALLSVASIEAHVLPQAKAPYVKRAVVVGPEHDVPIPDKEAGQSAIHKRITKHLRLEDGAALQRRLARGNNGGPMKVFASNDDRQDKQPEPIKGDKGYKFLHESNKAIDQQNVDYLRPPSTDAGNLPNFKWSFSLSHTRLLRGGWVREQTVTDLPASKEVSAAELVLAPYAFRELHWHRVSEWALVINGSECHVHPFHSTSTIC